MRMTETEREKSSVEAMFTNPMVAPGHLDMNQKEACEMNPSPEGNSIYLSIYLLSELYSTPTWNSNSWPQDEE